MYFHKKSSNKFKLSSSKSSLPTPMPLLNGTQHCFRFGSDQNFLANYNRNVYST